MNLVDLNILMSKTLLVKVLNLLQNVSAYILSCSSEVIPVVLAYEHVELLLL
jgi:hypothetical protein